MMLESFVAIDLETTGLDLEKDEIIEVALVLFEQGRMTDKRSYLIRPSQDIRPFIRSLTGISENDVKDAAPFENVAQEIFEFIGSYPMVAHNAGFDFKFLKKSFAKSGLDFGSHPVLDSLTLSRIVYREVANHRLETLVKYLNIERSASHRALPDAEACGHLFCKALEEIRQFSAFEKNAIASLVKGTVWEMIFKNDAAAPKPVLDVQEVKPAVISLSGAAAGTLPRARNFFEEGGVLASRIPGYQVRASQIDFAEVVERNMYKGGICMLEAGTGTGKTLAYLIPSVLKALSGERVVISTATRALQEQLWQRDLPLVASLFQGKRSATLLKGRQNYVCYRKFQEVLDKSKTLLAEDELELFLPLIPWAARTVSGDISENTGFTWTRHRSLWSKTASDAASCTGEKCPFYEKCPALCARRAAMQSNLVLVNHSLFLADLSLDFALLPVYEHIVFDEAHRLPELSHESFGKSVRFFRFKNIAKNLVHPKLENKGWIASAENAFEANHHAKGMELCASFRFSLAENEKLLHRLFMKIGKKLPKVRQNDFRFKENITAAFGVEYQGILTEQDNLKLLLSEIIRNLRDSGTSFEDLARDLEGVLAELSSFTRDFEWIAKAEREDTVFYLEEPFNPHTLQMKAIPLAPGNVFAEKFYPWVKSVTFTSATLSTAGTPDYFSMRMGFAHPDLSSKKAPFFRAYEAPFDLHSRRRVIIAEYLPKPGDVGYQKAIEDLLSRLMPLNDRNAMILFTSIASMNGVYTSLSKPFAEKQKLLLCQHVDGGMDNLVEMFRKERKSCLLGSQLLWEGVDLPGEALELLVIPRLPFPNPSDPLIAALSDRMKEQKENAFRRLFIPEALLELRQGMGRLIRGEQDRGVVLFLDSRLLKESYGRSFSRLWNHKDTVVKSEEELFKALEINS